MDLRKLLLLLLLSCVLLLEVNAARPRGRVRGPGGRGHAGGKGRVRGHGPGRVRGKGRPRGRKPVGTSKAPERTPVYLQLEGEEQLIPVYPLAPGSGHQPFTVRVVSAHLADQPSSEAPRQPTSQVPSSFEPPVSQQSFSAADAGGSVGASESLQAAGPEETSLGSRPAGLPGSISNAFGDGFFEAGSSFDGSPSRFPNFETALGGDPSRRRGRGGRRLFPPAEVSGVTAEVSEVTAQLPPDVYPQYTGSQITPGLEPPPQQYEFGYLVDDRRLSGTAFGLQQSVADGLTRGRYEVQLPDGRTQVVTYTAGGERGYEADVQYIGEADTGTTQDF